MRDLRSDLGELWREVSQMKPRSGARVVQFIAQSDGEGTTSVATSFALLAAGRARQSAWLVDLSFVSNPVSTELRRDRVFRLGGLGPAYDADLKTRPPVFITGAPKPGEAGPVLAAHRVGETRLLVTRLRTERLHRGWRAGFAQAPDWWRALRRITDFIIVDSPAIEASRAGLACVGEVDGVVLVGDAGRRSDDDMIDLKYDVERAGGRVISIVMNGARADTRPVDRLFG